MNPYEKYIGKTVKIKQEIFEDGYLDVGMLATVERIVPADEHCDKIHFDLSKFHEHNLKKEEANYWDQNHVACLTASQAGCYPKNHKDSYYLDKNSDLSDYLEIIDDTAVSNISISKNTAVFAIESLNDTIRTFKWQVELLLENLDKNSEIVKKSQDRIVMMEKARSELLEIIK